MVWVSSSWHPKEQQLKTNRDRETSCCIDDSSRVKARVSSGGERQHPLCEALNENPWKSRVGLDIQSEIAFAKLGHRDEKVLIPSCCSFRLKRIVENYELVDSGLFRFHVKVFLEENVPISNDWQRW